jgi:hypothetical protein
LIAGYALAGGFGLKMFPLKIRRIGIGNPTSVQEFSIESVVKANKPLPIVYVG